MERYTYVQKVKEGGIHIEFQRGRSPIEITPNLESVRVLTPATTASHLCSIPPLHRPAVIFLPLLCPLATPPSPALCLLQPIHHLPLLLYWQRRHCCCRCPLPHPMPNTVTAFLLPHPLPSVVLARLTAAIAAATRTKPPPAAHRTLLLSRHATKGYSPSSSLHL
ncbi:hypothetical protein BHE74_00030752 [Ensete ventricosum]|nr:hypothetical protein BHE74_00030752 [Ensete ventricosum]